MNGQWKNINDVYHLLSSPVHQELHLDFYVSTFSYSGRGKEFMMSIL